MLLRFNWLLPSFKYYTSFEIRRISDMSSVSKCTVAVCQIKAGNNKQLNFETCENLVKEAKGREAKMVFLPEGCDYIAESKNETLSLAEPLDGPLITKYRKLAKNCNVWLSLGGIHEQALNNKVRNSHVLIDDEGNIKAVYRKTHLFDVDIPSTGVHIKESDYVKRGEEILDPIDTPLGKLGLGICYDVRFPEFGLYLANKGADALTYPSAFTYATGAVHWEVVLRGRAIETQTYVIAAAQTGVHNKKRSSWGHAMVIDPWGTVIAQCPEGIGFVTAVINLEFLSNIRSSMPFQTHRRNDLYPKLQAPWKMADHDRNTYQFGQTTVKASQVFLKTEKSMAFTNKKCAVPGHVLVSPIRCVKRYSEMKPDEVVDMWITVQKVQALIEKAHNAQASTITIQDGADAGQTIEHVHVHILPRKPGDFKKNDDVYVALEQMDNLEPRPENEMTKEAEALKSLLGELA